MNIDRNLLNQVVDVALKAGKAVMEVYAQEFSSEDKDDKSPLTEADLASNRTIVAGLKAIDPTTPILSEEMKAAPYAEREGWSRLWVVDPLDGTKEFIKRNGQFTVNIALVEKGVPILGVVHAPAIDTTFAAAQGVGATKVDRGEDRPIRVANAPTDTIRIVASLSHNTPETQAMIDAAGTRYAAVETLSLGSSLKLCMVADGRADLYPRLAPTMEWDTCAAQAVVEQAGGTVVNTKGERLTYNRAELLNPWFLVIGDPSIPWRDFLPAELKA